MCVYINFKKTFSEVGSFTVSSRRPVGQMTLRNSVTLLTSEWFVSCPGSASCVASYSPFFAGCFMSPFQFMHMPTLWVSGMQTSAECDLTDPDDGHEGMHFALLLWFSNSLYKERNSRGKKTQTGNFPYTCSLRGWKGRPDVFRAGT